MTTKSRLPRITCPHCGTRTIVRSSEQVTPTYREVRLSCENEECGHTMLAGISIIRTIRPSARPNPDVMLPIGNQNLRVARARPANDDTRVPANDEQPLGPETEAGAMIESG
ncbi:ogr/Delta-like zinc finger family protein [Sphingomonas sp. NFR15]|uniref:ogr/Delta-like zinc finger family protein n=1 Tax=Sphingomonas sp. NFR15 TaxID=1566282 RepID=UPI0008851ADF|nr:ogr/Delta-like zinc finger family protein [Sphingomonas sp. NFR15]SDA21729.1 Ogr/Delta-like zinc finger [Sphingomonas sp. NFR15]